MTMIKSIFLSVALSKSILSNSDSAKNVCDLPKAEGKKGDNKGKRYYFNGSKNTCESFEYKGKDGNLNNFTSEYDCRDHCTLDICLQDKVVGTGNKKIKQYFFNKETAVCEEMIYKGGERGILGEGENNFKTLEICNKRCDLELESDETPLVDDMGIMPTDVCTLEFGLKGTGNKNDEYYSFKFSEDGKQLCEKFTYSGEGGNDNKFETLEKCQDQCVYEEEDSNTPPSSSLRDGDDRSMFPEGAQLEDDMDNDEFKADEESNTTTISYMIVLVSMLF